MCLCVYVFVCVCVCVCVSGVVRERNHLLPMAGEIGKHCRLQCSNVKTQTCISCVFIPTSDSSVRLRYNFLTMHVSFIDIAFAVVA